MHTQHSHRGSTAHAAVASPAPEAAARAPLTGIERLMAEALMALDAKPSGAVSEPGAIEYASWMRLLRSSTP